MPRLDLSAQTTPGSYPTLPLSANAADFTWTAAVASFADGFSFPWTGKEVLLVRNDDAAAQTVTINSVADDRHKRTGDIAAYSVGAAEYAALGPFGSDGWKQSTGLVHGAASDADVKLAVIRLNN